MPTKDPHQGTEENDSFFTWLDEFRTRRADPWDHVPDIGLYMDQVVGYLNDRLSPFGKERDAAVLTPSMVNNYVKFSYVTRPERKRYSREQIAVLYLLCSMKQTLPMAVASALIGYLTEEEKEKTPEALYRSFTAEQEKEAERVAEEVLSAKAGGRAAMMRTALELTLRAEAMRMTAERMISDAMEQDKTRSEEEREAHRLALEEERKAARATREAKAAQHAERAKPKTGEECPGEQNAKESDRNES